MRVKEALSRIHLSKGELVRLLRAYMLSRPVSAGKGRQVIPGKVRQGHISGVAIPMHDTESLPENQ
ncbi:MAG: hypothetical protein HBSIN02_13380 [Bacteroidia bacterium]|nr:MAG: hypothetical protein HBSIN02_13380 [Bacteroidia bacterium]